MKKIVEVYSICLLVLTKWWDLKLICPCERKLSDHNGEKEHATYEKKACLDQNSGLTQTLLRVRSALGQSKALMVLLDQSRLDEE